MRWGGVDLSPGLLVVTIIMIEQFYKYCITNIMSDRNCPCRSHYNVFAITYITYSFTKTEIRDIDQTLRKLAVEEELDFNLLSHN